MNGFVLLFVITVAVFVAPCVAMNWRDWRYGKPHIVQFADGTYGVRRWSVRWEFLGHTEHAKLWNWWGVNWPEEWGIFATEAEARGFLVAWRCSEVPRKDVGIKVSSTND